MHLPLLRQVGRFCTLPLLSILILGLAQLHTPPLSAAVHTDTRFAAEYETVTQDNVTRTDTSVWLTVCGTGGYYRFQAFAVEQGVERLLWDEDDTERGLEGVRGCKGPYRAVIWAEPGDQLRFYSAVADRPLSDADFRQRARVDEYQVIANGRIAGGLVAGAELAVDIRTPAEGGTVGGVLEIRGSALDLRALTDAGVDAVTATLQTSTGSLSLSPSYGLPSPEAQEQYGDDKFALAGFAASVDTRGLPEGRANLQINVRSSATQSWTTFTRAFIIDNRPPQPKQIVPESAAANAGDIPIAITGVDLDEVSRVILRADGEEIGFEVATATGSTVLAFIPEGALKPDRSYSVVLVSPRGETATSLVFRGERDAEYRLHRVMVVMACDDSLGMSSFMLADCEALFRQLERAATDNPALHIIVLWDGPFNGDSGYYAVQRGQIGRAAHTAANGAFVPRGELDTGAIDVLRDFLFWAHSKFPGQYKFLALSGHGGGWAPGFRPPRPTGIRPPRPRGAGELLGGILVDANPRNMLSTADLADLVGQVNMGNAGLDLVYLDACLMATAEVLGEIGLGAGAVVAYENLTWPFQNYGPILSALTTVSDRRQLAETVVEAVVAEWQAPYPLQISAVDTAGVSGLLHGIDELALALTEVLESGRPEGRAAIERAARSALRVNDSYGLFEDWSLDAQDTAVDLLDFARMLKREALPQRVIDAAEALEPLLEERGALMIRNYRLAGTPPGGSQLWPSDRLGGISIYFPLDNSDWRRAYYDHSGLPRFAPETAWDEFILAWHGDSYPPLPEPCASCGAIPARVNLRFAVEDELAVANVGDVIYLKVRLEGASDEDNLRTIELNTVAAAPWMLEPAQSDAHRPRIGGLYPADDLWLSSTPVEGGWRVVLSVVGDRAPLSGSGVIVELPFRVRASGSVGLTASVHRLVTGERYDLPHRAPPATARLRIVNAGQISGQVQRQHFGASDEGVTLEVSRPNGSNRRVLRLAPDGSFQADLAPGDYRLQARAENHLLATRELRVRQGERTELGKIVLWAGDLNGSGRIVWWDQQVCALAGAPVNDASYDLDGDGAVDGKDCQAIAANAGARAPTAQNPDLALERAAPGVYQPAAQIAALSLCRPTAQDVGLCVELAGQPVGGLGLRLRLPKGVTFVREERTSALAHYDLAVRQEGQSLYLIGTLDEAGQAWPIVSSGELLRLTFDAAPDGVAIEAQHALPADERQFRLFLPLLRR